MAASAVGGAVGSYVGGKLDAKFPSTALKPNLTNDIIKGVASGIAGNVASQLTQIAINGKGRLDWTSVAVSGIYGVGSGFEANRRLEAEIVRQQQAAQGLQANYSSVPKGAFTQSLLNAQQIEAAAIAPQLGLNGTVPKDGGLSMSYPFTPDQYMKDDNAATTAAYFKQLAKENAVEAQRIATNKVVNKFDNLNAPANVEFDFGRVNFSSGTTQSSGKNNVLLNQIVGGVVGGETSLVKMINTGVRIAGNAVIQVGDILTGGINHDDPFIQQAWIEQGALANGIYNAVTSPKTTYNAAIGYGKNVLASADALDAQGKTFEAARLRSEQAADAFLVLDGGVGLVKGGVQLSTTAIKTLKPTALEMFRTSPTLNGSWASFNIVPEGPPLSAAMVRQVVNVETVPFGKSGQRFNIGSDAALVSLFDKISVGTRVGEFTKGQVNFLPDGTRMQLRFDSNLGGKAIEVTPPKGKPYKIHVDPNAR